MTKSRTVKASVSRTGPQARERKSLSALGCFRTVAAAIDIPIMVQDAPLGSTRLSAAQLAALARDFITRSVRPGR